MFDYRTFWSTEEFLVHFVTDRSPHYQPSTTMLTAELFDAVHSR